MGFFSPHKRHANKFSYTPRYFDPEKEAREQRRAELRGERLDDDSEYTPGKYLRAQREAREQSRSQRKGKGFGGNMRLLTMVAVLLLVFMFAYILVPRISAVFNMATSTPMAAPAVEAVPATEQGETFDLNAPFIIVPNDYVEGEEIVIVED